LHRDGAERGEVDDVGVLDAVAEAAAGGDQRVFEFKRPDSNRQIHDSMVPGTYLARTWYLPGTYLARTRHVPGTCLALSPTTPDRRRAPARPDTTARRGIRHDRRAVAASIPSGPHAYSISGASADRAASRRSSGPTIRPCSPMLPSSVASASSTPSERKNSR